MAIKDVVPCAVYIVGDDVSTVFVLDLEKDPYSVGIATVLENWFGDDKHVSQPTGIRAGDTNQYSLSNLKVTITFTTPPASDSPGTGCNFYLLFG